MKNWYQLLQQQITSLRDHHLHHVTVFIMMQLLLTYCNWLLLSYHLFRRTYKFRAENLMQCCLEHAIHYHTLINSHGVKWELYVCDVWPLQDECNYCTHCETATGMPQKSIMNLVQAINKSTWLRAHTSSVVIYPGAIHTDWGPLDQVSQEAIIAATTQAPPPGSSPHVVSVSVCVTQYYRWDMVAMYMYTIVQYYVYTCYCWSSCADLASHICYGVIHICYYQLRVWNVHKLLLVRYDIIIVRVWCWQVIQVHIVTIISMQWCCWRTLYYY